MVVDIYWAAKRRGKYPPLFTEVELNNCFSIYHTSWITSSQKSNFTCDNVLTKAILFFFSCLEVDSTRLITSELANQHARKVLFICVVYTKKEYTISVFSDLAKAFDTVNPQYSIN